MIRNLHRAPVGSNYDLIRKKIKEFNLDTSHWIKKKHYDLKIYDSKTCLIKNSPVSIRVIKRIVMREKLIPYLCGICGCKPIWLDKPLTLRLDHINGIRNDHRKENLRFACPNCDSQSSTFCGRNKRNR